MSERPRANGIPVVNEHLENEAVPVVLQDSQQYNETLPTYEDGDDAVAQFDANGRTIVTKGTLDADEDLSAGRSVVEQRGYYYYQAAAAANVVVKSTAGFLYGIIIGKDVASAVVEVSDHASDGDGNVQIYLEGSTLLTSTNGYVPVNAVFANGITADLTNQTNVTFIYR